MTRRSASAGRRVVSLFSPMPRVAIDMIAVTDFEHDGCAYTAGECFQVPPIHAAALKYQRKAAFATKDQLRTRDLKAAEAAEAATPEPDQPRTRRQYRRRDLVAEP